MTEANSGARKRRRSVPLLWGSGLIAAAILILGVNGTLSSWTSAVINNDNNSAASATAVALKETGGAGTDLSSCDTLASATSTASCTTINKYAGTAGGGTEPGAPGVAPLAPGGSRTATVTMLNDGTGSGTLTLQPGACTNTVNDTAGVDTTAAGNLCNYIQVAISCTGGATFTNPAATLTSLAAVASPGLTIGTLAASASTTCTFTVTLDAAAPASVSNQLATQPLVWTLTA